MPDLRTVALPVAASPARAVQPIVAAGALVLLAVHVARALTDAAPEPNSFGTLSAPYSDALGPWLAGGLSVLVGGPAPSQLVRPTVGVFWSSLLAAAGRIEAIPLFFVLAAFAVFSVALFALRDAALQRAYTAVLALAGLGFGQIIAPLSPATTNVDFAAFVFTFAGSMLILAGEWHSTPRLAVLLAGAALLGIAGAIRGPMLVAGPILLAARLRGARIRHVVPWLLVAAAFAAPFAIDVALQHRLGVHSNATGFLYCAYADPAHSPTPECARAYLSGAKPARDIVREYLAFVFSTSGAWFVANGLSWRLARELAVATNVWVTVAMALSLAAFYTRVTAETHADRQRPSHLKRTVLLVGSLVVFSLAARLYAIASVGWLALTIFLSLRWRVTRALVCLVAYACGTLFLTLLGVQSDRYEATFAFLLYLGVALLALEPTRPISASRARPVLTYTAAAAMACAAFLYMGQALLPSSLRTTYQHLVQGRTAALKIADDGRLDRSLYYTGAHELVYTRRDDRAVGTVRPFRSLMQPGVIENESFRNPNAFVE